MHEFNTIEITQAILTEKSQLLSPTGASQGRKGLYSQ
jgi:hypothetical protein